MTAIGRQTVWRWPPMSFNAWSLKDQPALEKHTRAARSRRGVYFDRSERDEEDDLNDMCGCADNESAH
ncbi:hypothetical protein Y032_0059g2950 [Ancylostoma ceylanicum]|uniref:Uncharacterized protein n=1 Tax=Ancylostoma ceylanicum TaxID=53326 RepID=A0A016U4R7_9BILA|nr:hypothetical protein Y032_0059g2950 [Ancylostoma ceylanicum]